MLIRHATPEDAGQILEIYAPYVTDTAISFETVVPTIGPFTARLKKISESYPYLVCEDGGRIVGFAYANVFKDRPAYIHSAETTIYIHPDYHRRGIARALYQELFPLMIARDIYTAYAIITVPNEKSIGFHTAMGFTTVGTCHNVGYKLGQWRDVAWLEKPLRDPGEMI